MPAGRPTSDAAKARLWLEAATKREPTSPEVMAALAAAHASIALHDRLGALLDRMLHAPSTRVPVAQQAAADDAAIDRARMRARGNEVVRFITEDIGIALPHWQESAIRSLVAGEHGVVARDRAWYEQQAASREDASQYADLPTADERRWASEVEVAAVEQVEAQIDPDLAATNAQRRREAREEAAMDRAASRGVGVFGQMSTAPEEDG